jgi:hypothetical protein
MWVRIKRRVHVEAFLRRGLAVRCRMSEAGRCNVRVTTARGALIARGSRALAAGLAGTVRARPTQHGRRLLRHSSRISVLVHVRTRGAGPVIRRVRLAR